MTAEVVEENGAAWVPPDTFERKSTKFWAHPSVIPALQACQDNPPGKVVLVQSLSAENRVYRLERHRGGQNIDIHVLP